MDRQRSKRKQLGQNFLRNPRLAEKLVALSSIGPGDVVYEIGPGRGIITAALARRALKVIAVERDPALVRLLKARFAAQPNVEIVGYDFLRYRVRERPDYKIFASVPYGITASVMRKVLYERPLAREICFIIQREAAEKYAGCGRRGETVQSLTAKPHFTFELVFRLRRRDFEPVPDVDSVLLKITRRQRPLLESADEAIYRAFIRRGFCSWRQNARLALKRDFAYKQWKHLSCELGFEINARPSELNFEQWLGLFRAFTEKRDVR